MVPSTVFEDGGALIAIERNLVFLVQRERPTSDHLRALRLAYDAALAAHPDGVALLMVVTSQHWMPAFSDELREETAKLVRGTETGSLGSAFVLGGRGLFSSTLRAFLSTLFLVAGSREPYAVFADVESAAPWLAGVASRSAPWRVEDVLKASQRVLLDAHVGSAARH
ncbi:MAG: hypothetical protein RLP09_08475 [Sandaracinaceae bacterium]